MLLATLTLVQLVATKLADEVPLLDHGDLFGVEVCWNLPPKLSQAGVVGCTNTLKQLLGQDCVRLGVCSTPIPYPQQNSQRMKSTPRSPQPSIQVLWRNGLPHFGVEIDVVTGQPFAEEL